MRSFPKIKLNNGGMSLVELIVTISIMSILVGTASLGVGLAFSKDAAKCATRLNDSIYEARSRSMYKTGKYVLTIDTSGNTAVISQTDVTPVSSETVYLDGVDSAQKTEIRAKFVTEAVPAGTKLESPLELPVTVTFDKSKGNVLYFDANGDRVYDDGIIVFDITPRRGNRTAKVQLVTTTGKHTIGEFE